MNMLEALNELGRLIICCRADPGVQNAGKVLGMAAWDFQVVDVKSGHIDRLTTVKTYFNHNKGKYTTR